MKRGRPSNGRPSWGSLRRIEERRRITERNRHFVQAYKSFMGCQRCPESRIVCLEFHHLEPLKRRSSALTITQLKQREIPQLVCQGKSLKRICEEMNRCLVLCANCHKLETARYRIQELETMPALLAA